jgi:hypothetical protein
MRERGTKPGAKSFFRSDICRESDGERGESEKRDGNGDVWEIFLTKRAAKVLENSSLERKIA